MARRGAYGASQGDRRSRARSDSWPERNPVTLFSVLLAVGFLFGTPQVRLILFDFPSFDAIGLSRDGLSVVSLWLYTLLLFGAYFAIAWSLFDSRTVEEEAADDVREGILGWPHRWVRRLQRMAVPVLQVMLVEPAQRRTRASRRGLGVIAIFLGLVPPLVTSPLLRSRTGITLQVVWPRVVSAGMLLVGLWLLLARLPTDPGRPELPRERAVWDHRVQFSLLWGRCIELAISGSVAGELIWLIVNDGFQSLSWRTYTLWGSCQIALFILIFGRLADAFGRRTWTRMLSGLALLGIVGVLSAGVAIVGKDRRQPKLDSAMSLLTVEKTERNHASDVTTAEDLTDAWFDQVNERLDRLDALDDQAYRVSPGDAADGSGEAHSSLPVLFVAASGGGSRAALWSTWVLEALERIPIESVGLDGKAASKNSGSLADAVLFISSVSGGSLGGVNWALGGDRYYDGLERPEQSRTLVNTNKSELERGYRELRDRLCSDRKELREWAVRCRPGGPSRFVPLVWPAASARADLMATDFNAPTLRGMVLPGIGRGQSLQGFWDRSFHWRESPDFDESEPGDTPLLLINSTEVQTGFRLVAGWPQLPPGLLWDSGAHEVLPRMERERRAAGDPIEADSLREPEAEYRARVYWSGLRDPYGPRVRAVTDIDPYLEVRPVEAVRMSANFPWGFDIPQLNVEMKDPSLSSLAERVLVIDGGVLDNTGIDTLAALIERLDFHATSSRGNPRFQQKSREVLERLSRRGVVLVEIDSGAKPAAPGWAERVLRDTLMPVSALNQAAYGREREARLNHVRTIRTILNQHAEASFGQELTEIATRLKTERYTHQYAAPAKDYLKGLLNQSAFSSFHLVPPVFAGRSLKLDDPKFLAEVVKFRVEQEVEEEQPELQASEVVGDRVAHVTFTANRGENIMTAWALAPDQKGDLLYRFDFEHAIEADELQEDWLSLRGDNRLLLKLLEERAKAADGPAPAGAHTSKLDSLQRLIGELSEDQESVAEEEAQDAARVEEERAQFWTNLDDENHRRTERRPVQEGWVFLGYAQDGFDEEKGPFRWETVHLEVPVDLHPAAMPPGMEAEMAQRAVSRSAPADLEGRLGRFREVVPKNTRVQIQEVCFWTTDRNIWFAKVGPADGPTRAAGEDGASLKLSLACATGSGANAKPAPSAAPPGPEAPIAEPGRAPASD